ncbi:hypothetical protein AA103193_2888 [Tanticharoenia sakaeratensis NBRC 103193]|nr:hypothetical protein AA103193_2888 [Tanticharoenia sakaeratensis NBRC 103193]
MQRSGKYPVLITYGEANPLFSNRAGVRRQTSQIGILSDLAERAITSCDPQVRATNRERRKPVLRPQERHRPHGVSWSQIDIEQDTGGKDQHPTFPWRQTPRYVASRSCHCANIDAWHQYGPEAQARWIIQLIR